MKGCAKTPERKNRVSIYRFDFRRSCLGRRLPRVHDSGAPSFPSSTGVGSVQVGKRSLSFNEHIFLSFFDPEGATKRGRRTAANERTMTTMAADTNS